MPDSCHSLPYPVDFPADWPVVELGDVSEIKSGVTLGRPAASFATRTVPYLRVANVQDGYLDLSEVKEIPVTEAEAATFRLLPGDVLMIEGGDFDKLGRGTVWHGEIPECLHQNHVFRVRADQDRLLPQFLSAFSASDFGRRYFLISSKQTTNLASINSTQLNRFPLPLPPLKQQRKIARILTALDALIERTEALIAKLQAVKQGLMHDLFTRGVDEHGRLRPPHAEAPELYWESELGWIPKGWEVVCCREICREIVVGIVVQPARYYETEGVPVLRSANVREDGANPDDLVFMSEQSNQLHAKSQIRKGDILTVRTGYPGTSCIVPPEFDGANCVDIIISRPGQRILSEYLALWINSDFGKDQVLRTQGGLAQQHFNVGELKELLVALPPKEEQSGIYSRLQSVRDRVNSEALSLEKCRRLKSGLMQDLLTGRVRVTVDAAEEAAADA